MNQHLITALLVPSTSLSTCYRGYVGRTKGQGRPEQSSVVAWGPCELARACAELGLTGCALTPPPRGPETASPANPNSLWHPVAVPSTNQLIFHSRKAVGSDLPGGSAVMIRIAMQGWRVHSLVRELRSHMPQEQLSLCAKTRENLCAAVKDPT